MNHSDGNDGAAEIVIDEQFINPNYDEKVKEVNEVKQRSKQDYFRSFPRGYRFDPKDIELINDYLKKKVNNEPLRPNNIHHDNIYGYTPKQLSGLYTSTLAKNNKEEWYFFTPRERKYSQGGRPHRAAGTGY